MSHYISTFLYEPIIRQARRFSTPSVTAEPVDPQSNNHGSAMVDRGEAVQTSEDEESNATRPIIHHAPTISGLPEVQSPSVDDSRSITSPWEIGRDGSGNTQSARGSVSSISQTEGAGRRSVEAFPNLDHSNGFQNPPRLSSGRFRSTNTSMSSIHDSGLLGDSPRRSRRNTPQDAIIPGIGSDVNHMVDGVIPEDDGMRVMRNRIKEIQGMAISHNEKSRLMHELMTQRYKIYHPSLPPFHNPRNRSPISLRSQDRPLTPHSTNSVSDTMESTPPQTSVSSVTDQEKEYVCRVTSEDLRPTYYVRPIPLLGTVVHEATPPDSIDDPMNQEEQNDSSPPPGCVHYKRNVKLQCSACHRWCDSYNTAQISITSVPRTSPAELGSAAAPHTQRPDNVDLVLPEAVQAYARGRTVGRASLVRRPATSATALDSLRNPLHLNPSQRIARSASPAAASGLILINPTEGYDAMDIGDDIEIESSDEEDDVDFWGGESPRDRALSADRARRTAEMQFVRDDGEEDEDDDEDDDEVMEDESDDDDDEDYDHMEIFGHR
ncbi:hypothetical protein MMC19_006394 [Ptychographa xylographoides]|nr:hypothetical protein [Ptychographa xylographoides]